MGNKESNESAAVKRQAEGGACPMYELLDLKGTLVVDIREVKRTPFIPGGGALYHITKRAMVKKDYKELDEAIKSKITPYLYNGGNGKMVPIAHLTMLRNRDRPKSKQFFVIKDLGDEAFNFVFEGSDLLKKVTEGLDPEKCKWYFKDNAMDISNNKTDLQLQKSFESAVGWWRREDRLERLVSTSASSCKRQLTCSWPSVC